MRRGGEVKEKRKGRPGEHKERRGEHRISAALRGVISVQQIELITALSQLAFPHSTIMNITLSQKDWLCLPETGCLTDMPAILKISALYKFTSHHWWLLASRFSLLAKCLLAQCVLVLRQRLLVIKVTRCHRRRRCETEACIWGVKLQRADGAAETKADGTLEVNHLINLLPFLSSRTPARGRV